MELTIDDLHSAGINSHEQEVLNHVEKTIRHAGIPDDVKLELIIAAMHHKRQWSWVHVHP